MSPDQAQEQLLRALGTHSTAFKEEDIKWAFEAKTTQKAVVDWVEGFLGSETLLSKEELELYSKLEESGAAHRITTDHDLSLVRPLFDNQVRTALKCLKDSTSAIERHNQVLKQQQQALLSFQKRNDQAHEHWKRAAAQRHKKRNQEKQNVDFVVEELLQTTSTNTEAARHSLQAANSVFPSIVAESLRKDDRTLARIDRLARELKVLNMDSGQQTSRPLILCEKLNTYLADEIRCRLDRIYIETSQLSVDSRADISGDEADLELSLKAELDTLYSEIAAVAQMSTSLEFEKPLNEASRQKNAQNEGRLGSTLDYMDNSITYLLEKTDHMIMRAQIHKSHCTALDVVASHLHSLQTPAPQTRISAKDKAFQPPSQLGAPDRCPSETDGASCEAPSNPDPRRLLSVLGIPPLNGLKPTDTEDALDHVAFDRERKMRDVSSGVEHSVDQMITTYLNDSSSTQQTLVDALLADTAYGGIEMFDQVLRSEITTLEARIGEIGANMAELDLGRLKMANQEREKFVNRWAH